MRVKLKEGAILPTRATTGSAGYDLYSMEEVIIKPGQTVKVNTGISIEIPIGFVGLVFARSGLATKKGLRPANCVGVIDEDYRGDIIVALHNDSLEDHLVIYSDRIAQLVIIPYVAPELKVVEQLGETERNEGGFGSTGK